MSNYAMSVVEVIKVEHQKEFKLSKELKKILTLFLISLLLTIGCSVLSSVIEIPMFILVVIVGTLLVYCYQLVRYAKDNPNNLDEKLKVILSVCEQLDEIGVSSIEDLNKISNEIGEELERLTNQEKIYYSRISKIFLFIFFTPFAFLTKYVIENKILELKDMQDYFTLVVILIVTALFCMIYSVVIGNYLEIPHFFRKSTLKMIQGYLIDLKYIYSSPDIKRNALEKISNLRK